MAKKYYWLKLKDDFFNKKEIKRLRRMAGGDTYTVIYLKMLLLSLQDEGNLYFDSIGEDFQDELSLELDEEVDNVKMTLAYLESKGLLEIVSDKEYHLNELPHLVGSESGSAQRMRRHRVKKKQETLEVSHSDTLVTKSYTEIEKEKELELELDIEKEKYIKQVDKSPNINKSKKIEAEFNELWKLYPNKKGKAGALKAYVKAIKAGTTYETVESGLIKFQQHCQTNDWYSPAHGSTWFSGERWSDEYDTGGTSNGANRGRNETDKQFEDGLNF